MGTTIQHKRTATAGNIPTLAPGEFGIDLILSRAYVGNAAGEPQLIAHAVYTGNTSEPPTHTVNDLWWYRPDTQSLWFRHAGEWKLVGISEKGGTFKGHVTVRNSGDNANVFQTTDGGITVTGITASGPVSLAAGRLVHSPASIAGSGDDIVMSFTVPVTLSPNVLVMFAPTATNTTISPQVTIGSNPTKAILRADGTIAAGDLREGHTAILRYTGAFFELINPPPEEYSLPLYSLSVSTGTSPSFVGGGPVEGEQPWTVTVASPNAQQTTYTVNHYMGTSNYQVVPVLDGNKVAWALPFLRKYDDKFEVTISPMFIGANLSPQRYPGFDFILVRE